MNILVIEDNSLKREKIVTFLRYNFDHFIKEAASYNSGIIAATEQNYDFIILDMSMPTFDRNESTQGGRFRALAGKEVISKLNKLGKLTPFVVLTGYKDFSVDSRSLNLSQINDLLTTFGSDYKGCILFNSSETYWQEKLIEIIGEIKC
ncbi:response regulator [Pectobacterium versatile]|uniref:Response regulator n=1 Tax=Pectobacterium versatile TaxID=2488639 RepID=A0A855MEB8_9GAMM|nr:response regulator [Pectobacterium versatile]POY48919.1 hypothetical protein F131LOC_03368 [Pectobacterium versatile]QPK17729.1 response regulator [Pectobacterium versatile]